MRGISLRAWLITIFVSIAILVAMVGTQARPRSAASAQAGERTPAGAGEIGGVVTSAKGPEAGVWVIAETKDLGTKFVKIVVTDDQGRYMLPDLPKANYKIWVRGYGLVDSQPVRYDAG